MMKRRLRLCAAPAVIALALITAAACSRPVEESSASGEKAAETGDDVSYGEKGVVLTRASVWEMQADGRLKWVRYINAGDSVEWLGESRKLVNTSNNQENDYWHVYAGGDYWIRDYAVTGPAEPGIIMYPDTVIYSQPDLGSITTGKNKTIRRYEIVAVHPEGTKGLTGSNGSNGAFKQISAYYTAGGQYYVFNNVYVKQENVSQDPGDVKGMSLYQLALAADDPVIKRELLNNVLLFSGRFNDLVDIEFREMEFANAIENITARNFKLPGDLADEVLVYDIPDYYQGEQVDSLKRGDTVTATAKTKEPVSYGGRAEGYYWYKINRPRGWVYGMYLEDAK
jgi:hypothetical protein